MKRIALPCVLATGCILPVSTGAPMPATTVGKGRVGAAMSGEAPTLDLIADNDENNTMGADPIAYGAAPAAALTVSLSYGLGEHTDIEVAGEGALYYFFLPLPTGGSIGIRQHLDAGDSFDVGIAARIGQVTSSGKVETSSGSSESSASATYGALQTVVQTKRGMVRPLLAVNFMAARIKRDPSDADPFNFRGLASSITAGVMFVGKHALAGPYLAATNFYSDQFDNSGWFVSGGLLLALRPDRNREPDPPVQPYSSPPGMQPLPPPQPYPYPPPPAQPSPYPASSVPPEAPPPPVPAEASPPTAL
jgi:hypothetical protein